jgi:translation initiation factor 1 (eIF-1/SUI1)
MASKKPPISTGTSEQLKHNPFAALAGQTAPAAPQPATPTAAEPPRAAAPDKPRGRLVLRRETKHRGGKAVVVVTGFEAVRGFDAAAVSELAKRLKQALGCGGGVEQRDGAPEILLQGDQPAKVAELLRAQGFRVDGVTR